MKSSSKISQNIRANFWLNGLFWGAIFSVITGLHFLTLTTFLNNSTHRCKPSQDGNRMQVVKMHGLIEQFYLTSTPRHFPDTPEELAKGPTPIIRDTLKDRWERPLVYSVMSDHQFILWSVGADGPALTDDDLLQESR